MKGTFYPILLTLSGAMLLREDQQSSPSKFSFFKALVYFFVLHWDFGPLYITCGPPEVYFVPVSSQPLGIVIIFYLSCLSSD